MGDSLLTNASPKPDFKPLRARKGIAFHQTQGPYAGLLLLESYCNCARDVDDLPRRWGFEAVRFLNVQDIRSSTSTPASSSGNVTALLAFLAIQNVFQQYGMDWYIINEMRTMN